MVLIASLVLVSGGFQTPDLNVDPRLDRHVTFKTIAAQAEDAIAGLSKASGLELKTGGIMKREILLLRPQDVPLRDAMVRLAHACAGSWGLEGDVYFLTRTHADQARYAATQNVEFLAAMKTEIAEIAKESANGSPFTADYTKRLAADLNPRPTEGGGPARFDYRQSSKLAAEMPAGRLGQL